MPLFNSDAFKPELSQCEAVNSAESCLILSPLDDCSNEPKTYSVDIDYDPGSTTASFAIPTVSYTMLAGTPISTGEGYFIKGLTVAVDTTITLNNALATGVAVTINDPNNSFALATVNSRLRIGDVDFRVVTTAATSLSLRPVNLENTRHTFHVYKGRRFYVGGNFNKTYIEATEDFAVVPSSTSASVPVKYVGFTATATAGSTVLTCAEAYILASTSDLPINFGDVMTDTTDLKGGTISKNHKIATEITSNVAFRMNCNDLAYKFVLSKIDTKFGKVFAVAYNSNPSSKCFNLIADQASVSNYSLTSTVKDILKATFTLTYGGDGTHPIIIKNLYSLNSDQLYTYQQLVSAFGLPNASNVQSGNL